MCGSCDVLGHREACFFVVCVMAKFRRSALRHIKEPIRSLDYFELRGAIVWFAVVATA